MFNARSVRFFKVAGDHQACSAGLQRKKPVGILVLVACIKRGCEENLAGTEAAAEPLTPWANMQHEEGFEGSDAR